MKKHFLIIFLLALVALNANAQVRANQRQGAPVDMCGTVDYVQSLHDQYPNYFEESFFEQNIQEHIRDKQRARVQETIYKIPVVVHIIHRGEPVGIGSNLSLKQVVSQMEALNDDFRQSGLGYNEHEAGADVKIEFYLATKDPYGNAMPEPGVHRVEWANTWARKSLEWELKPATYWNPYKYFNIWTVDFPAYLGFYAYAQFPVSSGLEGLEDELPDYTDGILVNSDVFGKGYAAEAPYDLGRVTTHEAGHWLGLRHIWGDGDCSADDYCEDTPAAGAANRVCQENVSCESRDMIENYMDYTPDACKNIFTKDQKARMRTVMEVSPRRKELLREVPDCTDAMTIQPASFTVSSLPQYYRYVAEEVQVISVSTLGLTSADTYVELLTACDGERLAANDDAGDSRQSALTYQLNEGDEVLIRWDNLTGGNYFEWEMKVSGMEEGASCDQAVAAQEGTNSATTTNSWAWYSWSVDSANEKLLVEAEGVAIEVFTSCQDGEPVASGLDSLEFWELKAGVDYFIRLSGALPDTWSLQMEPVAAGESCEVPAIASIGSNTFNGPFVWASFTTTAAGNLWIYEDDDVDNTWLEIYRHCGGEPLATTSRGYHRLVVGAHETYLVKWVHKEAGDGFDWVISLDESQADGSCHTAAQASEGWNTYTAHERLGAYWFRYITPDYPVTLTFGFDEDSEVQEFTLYQGSDCNELSYIYNILPYPWNDSPLLQAGDTLYMVWNVEEAETNLKWKVNVHPQQAGDGCDDPHISQEGINETPGQFMNCWTQFTMPRSGDLTITSVGYTDQDTELEVYGTCSDLWPIVTNDDADDTKQSTLHFEGVAVGESFMFHWHNNWDNLPIQWNISISENTTAGALCESAHEVSFSGAILSGTPGHWYRAVVPDYGTVTITSDDVTTEDTYLQVYAGCSLELLAENDDIDVSVLDFQSKVALEDMEPGQQLLIRWADKWSDAPFEWQVSMSHIYWAPQVQDQVFSIAESSTPETLIGQLIATDANHSELTYAISAGNDPGLFRVDQSDGSLFVVGGLDYETQSEYSLQVAVSNEKLTTYAHLTIQVVDELELAVGRPANKLELFPNPASEGITVRKSTQVSALASVIDLSGRVWQTFSLGQQQRISVAALPPGVYLVQVLDGRRMHQRSFIKK